MNRQPLWSFLTNDWKTPNRSAAHRLRYAAWPESELVPWRQPYPPLEHRSRYWTARSFMWQHNFIFDVPMTKAEAESFIRDWIGLYTHPKGRGIRLTLLKVEET